jgi:hypothetical protein
MQSMSGKWIPSSINNKIKITRYWLAGFIDAPIPLRGSSINNKIMNVI